MMSKHLSFISLAAAALLFGGCAADGIWEEEGPDSFHASFEQPENTRTFLSHEGGAVQMFWTQGDQVTLYQPGSTGVYSYRGNTGTVDGVLGKVAMLSSSSNFKITHNYAVYPHKAGTSLVSDGVINYEIPATQTYVPDSFGPGAALMAAATTTPEDTNLSFQSAVGYLVLNIYGGVTIQSISLKGKADEPLSGAVSLTVAPGQAPSLSFGAGAGTELTLDCGEGVETGATEEEATAFWIAVAPTAFSQGITVTVTDTYGNETVQATDNPVNIVRNVYQPMAAFELQQGEEPIPELLSVNYGLPVLYINLPAGVSAITSKEVWIEGAKAYLKDTDGTVTSLGGASVRGRGNSTWGYVKKPYALKFDEKTAILGMPKDKRWNLLANFLDRTRLRNDIALEMGRRLTGLAWTPKGKYVDLVINNVHQGNYYLVEHIKVAKNRVNIKEMKSEDVTKATISGGYLMEMSTEFDEVNKFTTKPFTDFYSDTWGNLHNGSGATILPVMIKSPDEETMVEDQLTWIHNHVDTVQTYVTTHDARWYDYVDLDSFVDWLFVQQVVGNNEPLHPKSCYMYKDRDKKLCMGPLWDFDYATFTSDRSMFVYNYCIWYGFMKSDAAFRQRMVQRWPAAKAAFQAVHDSYVAAQAAAIKSSVTRDYQMWGPSGKTINGDESDSYDYAASKINSNLQGRIDQMNALVASFSN